MENTKGYVERTAGRIASKFGAEDAQKQSEKREAERVMAIYKFCLQGMRSKQYQWFLNDNSFFNRKNIKYNLTTRTLEPIPQDNMEDRISVNKVKQLHRGVVSYLNREHPMIDIRPGNQSDQAYLKSRNEQHLVEYWYDHLQMNKKNKIITGAAAKYGVGWAKIAWDDDVLAPTAPFKDVNDNLQEKLKGEVMYEPADTWEILADPLARDKGDMRFIIHALPRTLNELQNKKGYKNVELAADKKLSVSPYRNAQLMAQTVNNLSTGDAGMETVMVLESFSWVYTEGSPIIKKTVITESGILLQEEEWPMDEFPFEYYQTDVSSSIYDSEGVIKDIRDLVRSLNINASQVQETVRVMGKLNWTIAKGSGVNVIRDKTGDFIEYDPSRPKPEQTHPSQLPQYVEQHIGNLERWIDDIGGAHNAFYGKSPFSRASGEAIKGLQDGDSNSLAMMRDNMDDFLARSFKLMLKTFKSNASGDRHFRAKDANILSDVWVTVKPEDISLDDDVQVRTGTALPYSQNDKIDMVTNLFKEGLVKDPNVALKLMGLTEVENAAGNEQLDIERQTEELRHLIKGEIIDDPIISEDHNVHIRVIDQFAKTPDFKKLKPKVQQMVLDHRQAHVKNSIALQKLQISLNVEPLKRNESLMIRAASMAEFTPLERDQIFEKFAVNSDAADIQKRGGLDVQEPNAAIEQAHAENTQMAEQGEPVHISVYDNHKVHLEVHNALMKSPEFTGLTTPEQNMIRGHVKQHEQMLMTQTPQPGLVQNGLNDDIPMPSHKLTTAADKRRMMREAAKQQNGQA